MECFTNWMNILERSNNRVLNHAIVFTDTVTKLDKFHIRREVSRAHSNWGLQEIVVERLHDALRGKIQQWKN